MNSYFSIFYKSLSYSVLCTMLTSCGGSGDDNSRVNSTGSSGIEGNVVVSTNTEDNSFIGINITPTVSNQSPAIGLRIDENNYERVFGLSVVRAVDINADLQDYFNSIDPASLSLLSVDGNVRTYRCSNQDGRLQVTPIDNSTQDYFFNNCDLPRDFPAYRYNNRLRVQLINTSGDINSFPELQRSWSKTQTFDMTDLNLSPIPGDIGSIDILNGNATFLQSNDATSLLHHTKITSSNLNYERTTFLGVRDVSDYRFFLYDDLDNGNDASSDLEIHFNVNATGVGDIIVVTNPILKFTSFESSLESGAMLLNSSASTVIFQARGNDRVDILLDPEKDGSFEQAIPTDWGHL